MNWISGHGLIGGGLEGKFNLDFVCMIHVILFHLLQQHGS